MSTFLQHIKLTYILPLMEPYSLIVCSLSHILEIFMNALSVRSELCCVAHCLITVRINFQQAILAVHCLKVDIPEGWSYDLSSYKPPMKNNFKDSLHVCMIFCDIHICNEGERYHFLSGIGIFCAVN